MAYYMSKSYALFVILLLLSGCSNKVENNDTEKIDLSQIISEKGGTLHVATGAEMFVEKTVHASVGLTVDIKIGDTEIVEMYQSKVTYETPERMKPGMTGGDRASKRFYFRALRAGTTEIELITSFRGKTEKTERIEVAIQK